MADPGFYEIEVKPIEPVDTRILARQVVASNARGEQQLGSPNIVSDSGNARIRVKDSTTNRVIMGSIGTDPSSASNPWGMKVSKPGIDVLTAGDSDLIFNSQQNMFRIVASGSLSVAVAAAAGTYTNSVAHGLGVAPAFQGFVTAVGGVPLGGSYLGLPLLIASSSTNPAPTALGELSVDATSVYINFITSSAIFTGTFTIKYYLFQETVA